MAPVSVSLPPRWRSHLLLLQNPLLRRPIFFPSRPSPLKRLCLKQPFVPLSFRHLRRITDICPRGSVLPAPFLCESNSTSSSSEDSLWSTFPCSASLRPPSTLWFLLIFPLKNFQTPHSFPQFINPGHRHQL